MSLKFDTENKITYEELSPSLQNKIKKIINRTEFDTFENLVSELEHALNGIRITVTTALTNISSPKNDKELAIIGDDGIYSCYVYGNSKWIKIPDGDIYYTVTIKQKPHQTIRFYYTNDISINTTNNIVLKSGTPYRIKVFPDAWWYAGNLNVPETGIVDDDMTVTITEASRCYEYYIDLLVGKKDNIYGGGTTYLWQVGGTNYGKFTPDWIIDYFQINKTTSGYTSYIAFYGPANVYGLFNTFSMDMTVNNVIYNVASGIPNSSFNSSGDLSNLPSFTTEQYYNLLKDNLGKIIKLHISVT